MKTRLFFILAILLPFVNLSAQITFEEKTDFAGVDVPGESWGLSWGDANADGYPDVYLGRHYRENKPGSQVPVMLINNQDGTFTHFDLGEVCTDCHGASWGDVDNNGLQDLAITTGRSQSVTILYNKGDDFAVKMDKVGAPDIGRGRTPLWLEMNGDGRLDLMDTRDTPFDTLTQGWTSIYRQKGKRLLNANSLVDFDIDISSNLALLADVNGDNKSEMLLSLGRNSIHSYPMDVVPWTSTVLFDGIQNLTDVITGDFDGDLSTDMYLLRQEGISSVNVANDTTLYAVLYPTNEELTVSFTGPPTLNFDFEFTKQFYYQFFFGDAYDTLSFNGISFEDVAVNNVTEPHTPGVDDGVFLTYDSLTSVWTIAYSRSDKGFGMALRVTSATGSSIFPIGVTGFDPFMDMQQDVLMFNDGSGNLVDVTLSNGFNPKTGSISGVAADFDNDMDLDIYLACIRSLPNRNNIYLENDGTGQFSLVVGAHGALGSRDGLSEAVAVADYDVDGFMDIMTTNGNVGVFPGPTQLYRNMGNSNNYIYLDLLGTSSVRDGTGAVTYLHTGGVSQKRESTSGMHRFSQNHRRIHYGLGSNVVVDSIEVYWPSGIRQVVYGSASNQVLTIAEPILKEGSDFIEAEVELIQLSLFPNPTTSSVYVNWKGERSTEMRLNIVDINGRLHRSQLLEINNIVDVSELPAGLYFAEVSKYAGSSLESVSFYKE